MCDRHVTMLCVLFGILTLTLLDVGRAEVQTRLDPIAVSSTVVDFSGGLAQDTVLAHLSNPTSPIAFVFVFLANPDLGEDVAGPPSIPSEMNPSAHEITNSCD